MNESTVSCKARRTPRSLRCAVRSGKRYRYYVPGTLKTQSRNAHPNGRRIPAGEIERLVADQTRLFLANVSQVYEAIQNHVPELPEQKRLMERAAELSKAWAKQSPAQSRTILSALIARVDLRAARVDIHLVPARLPDLLRSEPLDLSPASEFAEDTDRITLPVPARLKRAGKEIKMVIEGPGPQGYKGKPDPTLIKLLAKVNALQEKLMTSGASLSSLADSEGVHRSYVSRLVRLAFLSPDIAQAIVEGRHPPNLTAVKLMRVSRLPLDRQAQNDALGFT